MIDIMTYENYNEYIDDVDWKLILDISNIWNQYSNNAIDITEFCKQYKDYILSQQNAIISAFNEEIWGKLNDIIVRLDDVTDDKTARAIFDDIYDWADSNLVLIKTNTENETF
jgi:hypothetical protein